MDAVVGTLRCAVEPAEKPRHFGPCPLGRIFDLLLEPAGRPVSIAASMLRSYLGFRFYVRGTRCLGVGPGYCV